MLRARPARRTTVPPAPPELRAVISRVLDGAELGIVIDAARAAALVSAATAVAAGSPARAGAAAASDAPTPSPAPPGAVKPFIEGAAAASALLLLPDAHDALAVLVLRALSVERGGAGHPTGPALCLRVPRPLAAPARMRRASWPAPGGRLAHGGAPDGGAEAAAAGWPAGVSGSRSSAAARARSASSDGGGDGGGDEEEDEGAFAAAAPRPASAPARCARGLARAARARAAAAARAGTPLCAVLRVGGIPWVLCARLTYDGTAVVDVADGVLALPLGVAVVPDDEEEPAALGGGEGGVRNRGGGGGGVEWRDAGVVARILPQLALRTGVRGRLALTHAPTAAADERLPHALARALMRRAVSAIAVCRWRRVGRGLVCVCGGRGGGEPIAARAEWRAGGASRQR